MAIISVEQIGPGRTASAKLNGRREVRTHTQPYRVITNSPYDTSYQIQAAFSPIGTRHSSDFAAFLVSKDPVADSKSKMVWIVPLVYSTERQRSENPTSDPVDIEWDTDTTMEPYQYDNQGQPLLNSAGDHYGDAIKGEKSTWTVVCVSNQLFIPSWIDQYKNAYNSDSCFIDGLSFQPGQCKVKKIHIGRWQNRESYRYRPLSITIKITDNPTINTKDGLQEVYGWTKNVIDEGLYQVMDDPWNEGDKLKLCCTHMGTPVTKSAALDGNGAQLVGTDGDASPPTAEQIVYNSFDIYKAMPFSALPLN